MRRMTYQQMCEGLAAANEWLSNLGIHDEQDRIRQHIRRIEALEQARQTGDQRAATEQSRLIEQLRWPQT